jgi:hypothetical protein
LVAQPDALTIVEWLFGPKNAFMLVYQASTQARSVASAEDAKNCEESDMAIPARVVWGRPRSMPSYAWQLTSGTHAVNLVLQILETR